MTNFRIKRINDPTLGAYLKKRRIKLRVPLQEAADKLNVNKKYLEVLEENMYRKFPPEVYAKGIIRRYSIFLKLDPKFAIRLYNEKKVSLKKTSFLTKSLLPYSRFRKIFSYRTLLIILTSLVAGVVLFYLFKVIYPLYAKPSFSLKNPSRCPFETTEDTLSIEGKIQPEAEIWAHDEKMFVDKKGNFKFDIFLKSGSNTVQFKVKNKFGRERTDVCAIEYTGGK